MSLLESPLSSVHLRQQPKRFETLLGLIPAQFDVLFDQVSEAELTRQSARHRLWTAERVARLVAKDRPILREYLSVTLLYLRQYPIQEVLAASFGLSQGHVSKIIQRITPLLEQVLPTPAVTVDALVAWLETLPAALRAEYAAPVIIDATEQRIERSLAEPQQRQDYSGKKSVTVASFNSSSPSIS